MKRTTITIKQYEEDYYIAFGYNGAQFGETEEKIEFNTNRSAYNEAHDRFVKDTNKYRGIPTPKYSDCKFETKSKNYTEEGEYRTYVIKVHITWQYIKE